MILLLTAVTGLMAPPRAAAQILSAEDGRFDPDSIRRDFRNQPYFGLYKDNYFIFGPSIGRKPTKENTNIKF